MRRLSAKLREPFMRILAIETTDKTGTVAAASDGNLLCELELDRRQRSAQSLAPGLHQLLRAVGWQPGDVQLAAVAIGPGSFTGLRIGVTTAKVFAYAIGAEILGVDTLETIAAAAPDDVLAVDTALDAQRGEVAARRFVRGTDGWFAAAGPQEILPIEAWLGRLVAEIPVSGPVLAKLAGRLPAGIVTLDPALWSPRAAQVARLAWHHHASGRRDDLWRLAPNYARRSAAEEKSPPGAT